MVNIDDKFAHKVAAQQVGIFETPIAYCQINDGEGFLQELERRARERKQSEPGLNRSNVGGWHSDTNMLQWGGPAAERLARSTIKICKKMSQFKESSVEDYDWTVRMWANVTPKGGLNNLHAHPGNLWAAVLYLDMGLDADEDASNGAFYVEDPRFPMSAMHNTAFRMIGVDGKPQEFELEFKLQRASLLVFPAWLRHGVRLYSGSRERLSIAMNIDAKLR